MDYKNQLSALLKKFTQAELADLLSVTERSIQNYVAETNPTKPHQKTIRKIDETYTKAVKEAKTYEDLKMGSAEARPVSYTLDRRNQKVISKPYLVPLVPYKARAGYVKAYDQVDYLNELEQYAIPPNVDPTAAVWRYFEVGGDSMEPTFVSGDMLLCSQVPPEDWREIRNFYTYVIVSENELLVKRVVVEGDDFILLSDNESQYPESLKAIADVKQLWVVRRHIKKEMPVARMFDMDKIRKRLKK